MKIGIIGAGAIAQFLLQQFNEQQNKIAQVTALYVRNREKYEQLSQQYGVTLYTEIDVFLQADIDIVVEAAEGDVVRELLLDVVKKKSAIIISVGGLVDEQLLAQLQQIALANGHTIYLPSGAIGGLDVLQNAHALGGVTAVTLTTRKPAQSLTTESISEPTVIFEGTAREAIAQFPKNMNVSIVLALAGIGFEQTKVQLMADPTITQNIHEIEIAGAFGETFIRVTNNPLPANPKTSYLAAMSIVGTLQRIKRNIKI